MTNPSLPMEVCSICIVVAVLLAIEEERLKILLLRRPAASFKAPRRCLADIYVDEDHNTFDPIQRVIPYFSGNPVLQGQAFPTL